MILTVALGGALALPATAQNVIDLDAPQAQQQAAARQQLAAQTATTTPTQTAAQPGEPRQMIMAVAPDRDAPYGKMRLFSRDANGNWTPDSKVMNVNFGRQGLAWGIGLHPRQKGQAKREGDWRTPSGLFRVGKVLGNPAQPPEGFQGWPYHHKTAADTWPEDPQNKYYNRLYTVPDGYRPAWYEKERFRLDDPAYYYLIVVDHNRERDSLEETPTSVPGYGSAIFFHTERQHANGKPKPSAGCTTLPRADLIEVIRWLEPGSEARYAVLAEKDYRQLWQEWDLPNPELFRN
ncbi:MAG: L,D-transpeptidase family protein [Verrucomicrobiota bacterium]